MEAYHDPVFLSRGIVMDDLVVVVGLASSGSGEGGLSGMIWRSSKPNFLEVALKRSVILPATLEATFGREQWMFEVVRGDRSCVEGIWGNL